MSAWISVHERMPEPDSIVLVWTRDGVSIDEFCMQSEQPAGPLVGGWIDTGYGFDDDTYGEVTHWMPLPAAPAEEDDDDHTCPYCAGTGEGATDSARCGHCKGRG